MQKSRKERRILTFSSSEDDDEAQISTADAMNFYDSASATPQYERDQEYNDSEFQIESQRESKREPGNEPEEDSYTETQVKKDEPPAKKRRGRPKKHEQEKKEKVVTRRSRRIVENPTLRKHHTLEQPALMLMPKPLRAFGLVPGASQNVPVASGALAFNQKPNGKQKPLVIDAERLHTASSRDKRFNLTTLDVLKLFVDEYAPRATRNELISEQSVLDEFKAHLVYNLRHLMDLHASVRDISNDISEVQRQKNETRRKILDLKRKHADVGTELSKVRKEYSDDKQSHADFMAMASKFEQLESAVKTGGNFESSEKLLMQLSDYARLLHPSQGVAAQLRAINAKLAQMVGNQ